MAKSVKGKIWQKRNLDETYVKELASKLGTGVFLSEILASKTRNLEEAENFLYPKLKNLLPDPFLLKDMEAAVGRTIKALYSKEKICIFADYDVDGATSSALIKRVLRDLGEEISIYVPDRVKEGYGPNEKALEKIKNSGVSLVITVDCGSVSYAPLSFAANIGLEVIVLDHHVCAQNPAPAVAVVNPNRIDESGLCRELAAVGVSFLFCVALVSRLREKNFFTNRPEPNLLKYLDLVALGTVCDVMPLTGLNRCFVTQGLKVISQRLNKGLAGLTDRAGLEEKPGAYHLGFVIGPRINAGGRVGDSDLGARLLSSDSPEEIAEIAERLERYNSERKTIEALNLSEAMEMAEKNKDAPIIFLYARGWHVGVIGILASRIKDFFGKPTAVISLEGGIGKASCRSVKGIDFGTKILEAKNSGLVKEGGGHAAAAGFTVYEEKLTELKIFLEKEFGKESEKIAERDSMEEYDLDLSNRARAIEEIAEEKEKLEPYGNGNEEPIFKFSGLFVLKAQVFCEKHINCLLTPSRSNYSSSKESISAVAFNSVGTPLGATILDPKPKNISVLGYLKKESWRNRQKIKLYIKDLILE